MANRTRSDIIAQLKEYIPTINVSSHDTMIDNLIDLAAEDISYRHNFRSLMATTPKTHDIEADEYYVDESDFEFTNFKEIRYMMWLKSSTGEHSHIKFKPTERFFRDHPYVDYTGNTQGKPRFYTRTGTRIQFNCQLDETVTLRIWYQQKHGNFASDETSHSFEPDNLGFQAIVATVLGEIHDALPGIQLSPKAQIAMLKKEYWISKLIEIDLMKSDEEIEMGENIDGETSEGETQPYSWV